MNPRVGPQVRCRQRDQLRRVAADAEIRPVAPRTTQDHTHRGSRKQLIATNAVVQWAHPVGRNRQCSGNTRWVGKRHQTFRHMLGQWARARSREVARLQMRIQSRKQLMQHSRPRTWRCIDSDTSKESSLARTIEAFAQIELVFELCCHVL